MNSVCDLFDLNGRVVLLTGGAGLLGQRYVRIFLLAGARVVVTDLDETRADQVAHESIAELGGDAVGIGMDVTNKTDIQRVTKEVLGRWGQINILINNAAIDPKFDADTADQHARTFEEYPLAMWLQSLDVNLTGTFLCCQVIGALMVRQGGGVIVNVGSTYGLVAPNQSIYQRTGEIRQTRFKPPDYPVTKSGVSQLTRYLAAYWRGKNIRVNTLTPGGVYNQQDEEFVQRYSDLTLLGRMADKDEMCGALLFLASDASSYMTGANLIVDGGWTAW